MSARASGPLRPRMLARRRVVGHGGGEIADVGAALDLRERRRWRDFCAPSKPSFPGEKKSSVIVTVSGVEYCALSTS